MQIPLSEDMVRLWMRSAGREAVIDAVSGEIERQRGGLTQTEYFRRLSAAPRRGAQLADDGGKKHPGQEQVRGLWEKILKAKTDNAVPDDEAALRLTRFLRILQPRIDVSCRAQPWDRWPAGAQVLAILGERNVTIPEVSKSVQQRVVGARDAQSLGYLTELCYKRLQLDCTVVLHQQAKGMAEHEAEGMLKRIREKPRGRPFGMIFVIGSPVVNPFANVIAREILRDGTGSVMKPPARFRWAFPHPDWFLAEKPESPISAWPPADEGIAFPGDKRATFPRVPDDLIGTKNSDTFKDCAILMMDCRSMPFLVLCAGHGGCGTEAAVEALGNIWKISELLEASDGRDGWHGRFFAVVEVNRTTETGTLGEVDNLEIDDAWIAWPE